MGPIEEVEHMNMNMPAVPPVSNFEHTDISQDAELLTQRFITPPACEGAERGQEAL
jgi:hypothetical protein